MRAIRILVLLVVGLVSSAALVMTTATPASAHAFVTGSTPTEGQNLGSAPVEVQVTFSETVSSELGGLTVLNSSGERVDNDDGAVGATGTVLSATLQPDLVDGTYVMNYRVVSGDGHPIAGAVVFGIGDQTVIDTSGVQGLQAGKEAGYELAAGVARFLTYLGALVAAGLAVFVSFVHDQRPDRRRLTPIVRIAAVVGGIGAVATVLLQAALLTGDGFSAMTNVSTLRDALSEGLDWATIILLVGLALVHLSTDSSKPVVGQGLAFYGGLAVAASFAFWGHSTTTTPRWLSFASDVVHVAAAAIWLGGLVGLGMTLWYRRRGAVAIAPEPVAVGAVGSVGDPTGPVDVDDAAPPPSLPAEPAHVTTEVGLAASTASIVSRFSTVAGISLVALVIAGGLLAWKEVGSFSALGSTSYGRLLLVKIGIVGLILVAAAYNRWRLVPEIEAEEQAEADGGDHPLRGRAWTHLTRTVVGEALAIVVVLGITATLVNIAPPTDALATETTSAVQTEPVADAAVEVALIPAVVGNNSVHITYSDADRRPVDLAQRVTVELTNPEQGLGPISRDGTKAATGHFIVDGLQIPTSGTWTLTLITRLTDFEQERTEFTYEVSS